jgi:tetratricopeptide (TPR) repeat protein
LRAVHFSARRDQEAVDCFDKALECGIEDAELFGLRGSCLQSLEWHLDAIDDFTRAISLEPDDCNLYFQRAMSKTATGDQLGFQADIQQAIRLSKMDNALNRNYNQGAKEMGWPTAAAMYEGQAALSGHKPDFIIEKDVERTMRRGRRPIASGGSAVADMKERSIAGLVGLYLAWLVAAGMLVSAAVESHPYSFYTLLRWICCPIFAYSAFAAHERNRMPWVWVFGVLALLYNPLFRVHLDRSTWVGVNWATAAVIVIAAAVFWKRSHADD